MRIALATVVAAAVAALAGCGGGDEDGDRTAAAEPVSPARAEAQLRRAFPDALRESEPVSDSIAPRLAGTGDELELRGSLATGAIARDPARGLRLETAAGGLRLSPRADSGASPARAVAGSQAALFADVEPGTGLLVQAAPAGFTLFVTVRDDGARPEFTAELSGGGRLEVLPKGNVAVLSDAAGAVRSPTLSEDEGVAATLSAPLALDAGGRPARVRLGTDGDSVRLDPVGHPALPLVARLELMPSGELGGGWFSYGVDRSLRRSRYELQGKRIEGLCASEERGELAPGEVEISREVASRDGCPSLVETGTR